ncbi:ATP-binding cassette domain-containing protein [Chitinophaga sp. MM2321]|uniref:ATP-binding cassette domain-containing protein n=1 Tax=Chitinophaga sp. MM2321 TaxID=3137178 RepID=UPI0032D59BCD
MKNELEVCGIIKDFGGHQLLTDCYLKCETGDIIGILGRNGTGKSTLLKIIFGILPAYNKSISINKKIYQQPYRHKNLIAYLPQHPFLPKNISIENIVRIFIDNKKSRNKIIENERIEKHIHKRVTALSGGELRYLEMLLLVNLEADFILLDEPFSHIEPLYREIIIELLKEYQPTKGFIITDHDYESIIKASDSLMLLTNGVCKKVTSLSELEHWGYLPAGTISV